MTSEIADNNLTFVVQGAIDERINNLISSIERHYPRSKIIISTWNGMDQFVKKKVYKIITSEDPGGFSGNGVYLNVNRQIVSSFNGLIAANTEYVIKLRSDLRILNANILKIIASLHKYPRKKSLITSDWVICTNLTTYNIDIVRKPLAICDWVFIGKTKDVKKFFDIPSYPISFFQYAESIENRYGDFTQQRYSAEQWIIYQAYKYLINHDNMKFENGFDDNAKIVTLHNEILANDIMIKSMRTLGLKSNKYKIYNFALKRMMTEKEWLRNYLNFSTTALEKNLRFVRNYIDIDRLLYNFLSFEWPRRLRRFVKRVFYE